jgi:hypothetical protein
MNLIKNNMAIIKRIISVALILIFKLSESSSQELMNLLEHETADNVKKQKVVETFYGTKIINGQSVEMVGKKVLQFAISHRFGKLNEGSYNFYGLDFATMRLGFDYGISKWWNVGIGRNAFNKTFDGYTKFRILTQTAKGGNSPLTVDYFSSFAVSTIEKSTPANEIKLESRIAYVSELLLARKINKNISLQLMPVWIHRNLVTDGSGRNDMFAIGIAGRYKLTKRFALVAEYYHRISVNTPGMYYNPLAVGIDIETGGHVFQLLLTNSIGMIESQFIPLTSDNWRKGGIHLGFNLSRVFSLSKKNKRISDK